MKQAVNEYPKEACAFLFVEKPYSPSEKWHVYPVKNISENPLEEWIPDKKEMLKAKQKARKLGLVKIGNIHTHPFPQDLFREEEIYDEISHPSDKDLSFARKFNDIVRGIIVVSKDKIHGIRFHDIFDIEIPVNVISKDAEVINNNNR